MSLTETGDGVSQERFLSAEISHLGSNKLLKYLRQYWNTLDSTGKPIYHIEQTTKAASTGRGMASHKRHDPRV